MLVLWIVLFAASGGVDCSPGIRIEPNITDEHLRIYEGAEAKIKEVPYVLFVVDYQSKATCTGGLIHVSWTLTAAHCIRKVSRETDAFVYAGFDDMDQYEKHTDNVQKRAANQIVKHPDYNPEAVSDMHDFMLIELFKPFDLNDYVKVIPLFAEIWPVPRRYSENCVAAGWGEVRKNEKTRKLRKAYVVARHGPEGCTGGCYSPEDNKKLICLTRTGRVCSGDSGGLLACHGKAVGVAHGIYLPEDCGVFTPAQDTYCKDTITIYMQICDQLNWIGRYVPGVPPKPKLCSKCSALSNSFYAQLALIIQINSLVT